MSIDNLKYKKMILGYTELMIACAENLAKHGNNKEDTDTWYHKFVRAPRENQGFIREKLAEIIPDLTIPTWAFVVFSKHVTRGQAYLSNAVIGPDVGGKMKEGDKVAAIYELNQKVQAFGTFDAGESTEDTAGLHRVLDATDVNLKDYSVLLVFPYYGVSIVEIKFQAGEEIVLSSC
jgi:hypothetical protein